MPAPFDGGLLRLIDGGGRCGPPRSDRGPAAAAETAPGRPRRASRSVLDQLGSPLAATSQQACGCNHCANGGHAGDTEEDTQRRERREVARADVHHKAGQSDHGPEGDARA